MEEFRCITVSFRIVLNARLGLVHLATIISVWYGGISALLTGLRGIVVSASRAPLTTSADLANVGGTPERAVQLTASIWVSSGFSGMVFGVVRA